MRAEGREEERKKRTYLRARASVCKDNYYTKGKGETSKFYGMKLAAGACILLVALLVKSKFVDSHTAPLHW